MVDNKKLSEDIIQHKKDAESVLADLNTRPQNIFGGKIDWDEIVQVRKKHIKNFVKSLEKQEQEFEHFK